MSYENKTMFIPVKCSDRPIPMLNIELNFLSVRWHCRRPEACSRALIVRIWWANTLEAPSAGLVALSSKLLASNWRLCEGSEPGRLEIWKDATWRIAFGLSQRYDPGEYKYHSLKSIIAALKKTQIQDPRSVAYHPDSSFI